MFSKPGVQALRCCVQFRRVVNQADRTLPTLAFGNGCRRAHARLCLARGNTLSASTIWSPPLPVRALPMPSTASAAAFSERLDFAHGPLGMILPEIPGRQVQFLDGD